MAFFLMGKQHEMDEWAGLHAEVVAFKYDYGIESK